MFTFAYICGLGKYDIQKSKIINKVLIPTIKQKPETSNTSEVINSQWQVERCRHGCDRMVVGFTTTCAISAYHH